MKIAFACDHRGYDAKKRLATLLQKLGHELVDFGCQSPASADYPDFAIPAARAVASGTCHVGILFDGSGIGMSIVANKIRGVRAALAHDDLTAQRAREHNHCNVLCVGTDLLTEDQVRSIVETFLATGFTDGRHAERVRKITQLEKETFAPTARL